MNSGLDSFSGSNVPAAISLARRAFSRRTNSLNATHSSAFVMTLSGCQTPDPVMAVPVEAPMIGTILPATEAATSRAGNARQVRVGPGGPTMAARPLALQLRFGLNE
jgi:hypothetical protein